MNYSKKILIAGSVLGLSGCGNLDSAHLVFGQHIAVGIDITATAPEQGGTLTLGYKDKNIAIIPVVIKKADGTLQLLGGTNNLSAGGDINDAYSTIGQFELKAGAAGTPTIGLGKFFATGVAAQYLADGFREKLKK